MRIFLLTLLAIAFVGCAEKIATVHSPYTFEECRAFWDRELSPVVEKQIAMTAIPYPEINEVLAKNYNTVTNRFGKLMVNLNTNYHKISPLIEGSSGLHTNGTPTITLYIPSIMDRYMYLKARNQPRWSEAFKAHVLVLYMHELDHLTYQTNMTATRVDASNEAVIWAKTVAQVIVPLFEKYNIVLLGNEWAMYHAWTNAGRKAESPLWMQVVLDAHSEVDGKTIPK